jgi:ABC-2 type transport system ATP-binding protein
MTGGDGPVLQAVDVGKRYGSRVALDGVSLGVRAGEIVGLLGPNGAGKTTTLSILATIVRPDRGRVLVHGRPPSTRALRSQLGLVPQSLALYPTLTAAQNLWHFGRMQGLSRDDARAACAAVLDDVGLRDRADDAMQTLSGGMQRRLNLACGVVHRPAVVLLDEPTVGVDLASREHILDLVRRFRDAGAAVIYSTHYMEEAERLCDRVLLIDRGTLVADGTVEELVLRAGGRTRMQLTYRGTLPDAWPAGVVAQAAGDGLIGLELASHTLAGEVLHCVRAAGAHVIDFTLRSPNLADAFIALTGRSLGDAPAA